MTLSRMLNPSAVDPASSVCVLHAGALGDCVLTLHLAMRLRHSGHRVTMMARSAIAAWAARRNLIDEFVWLDRVQWLWREEAVGVPPIPAGGQGLRSFDVVISFLGGAGDDMAGRLERVCESGRVVHINPNPTEATLREGKHITRQWADEILRQPNAGMLRPALENQTSTDPAESGESERRDGGNVLVHPGSGARAKCCPIDAMEAVVNRMQGRGLQVQWMIGPDEVERDGPSLRKRLAKTAPVLFFEWVEKAADAVGDAHAFVGNDSGMTHVAGLTGVTTVALFGPTDPRVWRPLGLRCHFRPFPALAESTQQWVTRVIEPIGI